MIRWLIFSAIYAVLLSLHPKIELGFAIVMGLATAAASIGMLKLLRLDKGDRPHQEIAKAATGDVVQIAPPSSLSDLNAAQADQIAYEKTLELVATQFRLSRSLAAVVARDVFDRTKAEARTKFGDAIYSESIGDTRVLDDGFLTPRLAWTVTVK